MQRKYFLALGGTALFGFGVAALVYQLAFSPAKAAPAASLPQKSSEQQPVAQILAQEATPEPKAAGVQLTVHDKQPLADAEWNQLSGLDRWNFWKRRTVSIRTQAGTIPELAEELSRLLEMPVLLHAGEADLVADPTGEKRAELLATKQRWKSVRPTPLAELLKQVLIPLKLCVRLEHGTLWIESQAKHDYHQMVNIYQVRDLVEFSGSPYSTPDFDSLIQLIQSTV